MNSSSYRLRPQDTHTEHPLDIAVVLLSSFYRRLSSLQPHEAAGSTVVYSSTPQRGCILSTVTMPYRVEWALLCRSALVVKGAAVVCCMSYTRKWGHNLVLCRCAEQDAGLFGSTWQHCRRDLDSRSLIGQREDQSVAKSQKVVQTAG